jgi:hypothetical protein
MDETEKKTINITNNVVAWLIILFVGIPFLIWLLLQFLKWTQKN